MGEIKKYKQVNVKDLIPYAKNAKKHDKKQIELIKKSIQEFGFLNPCLIDENNNIIAGHGRVIASKELGIDKIPCVYVENLTEEQRRAYILADNRLTELGEWDMELVNEELEWLDDKGFDIDLTGFELKVLDEEEVVEDDYQEEPPEEPKSKVGDLYQLGRHRLLCGSATDINDLEKLMDGEKADIAFTSPPYNAGTTPTEVQMGNSTKYNGNDDDKSQDEYRQFLDDYISNGLMFSNYVFMNVQSIANNKIALIDVLADNKDTYADTIIWDKQHGQPAMANNVLNSVFEYVHIFSQKANRAIGTIEFRGTIDNIMHLQSQHKNEYSSVHNATFSVEFASWFISRFAKESVLDQFGGTGTTMIACEQLNKKCFMTELEPKYVDVIIDRWEKFTGGKAVLLNTNNDNN